MPNDPSDKSQQVINASLSELVKAEDEEKLNLIYDKIKQNSELYQDNNKKIIDNHKQRTRTAIKLESKTQITETEKQLVTKLRNVINGDSEKNTLENLQKELNEYKNSSTEEKNQVYNEYREVIDLMLVEIKDELTRRKKSQKDQEKSPPRDDKKISLPNKKSTIPLVVTVASVSMLLIVFSLYLAAQRRKKLLKRKKK